MKRPGYGNDDSGVSYGLIVGLISVGSASDSSRASKPFGADEGLIEVINSCYGDLKTFRIRTNREVFNSSSIEDHSIIGRCVTV
jgi:hypothetical protein